MHNSAQAHLSPAQTQHENSQLQPQGPLSTQFQRQPKQHQQPTTSAPSSNSPRCRRLNMTTDQLQFLRSQGFTMGMIRAFSKQMRYFPLRIWLLDNSSAMTVRDAHIVDGNFQNVDATRWEELRDCVAYHAKISAIFSLPVRFSMLNDPKVGPQYLSLAQTGANLHQEKEKLNQVMSQTKPCGPTPLTTQLKTLRQYIVSIAPQIRARNQTISIVVATQGLPTNHAGETSPQALRDCIATLRSFESLPIWLVIRMCTDDENAFNFYNSIDKQLVQLPCDVLDDFYNEALEVYLHNPWLTYTMALHRYRELGYRVHGLDVLDERPLTTVEVRDLCFFLFDVPLLSDPTKDWKGFIHIITECIAKEQPHFNPVTKTFLPLINLDQLNAIHCPQVSPSPVPQPMSMSKSQSTVNPQRRDQPAQSSSARPHPPSPSQSTPPSPSQSTPPSPPPQQPKAQTKASQIKRLQSTFSTSYIQDPSELEKAIMIKWAKQPPTYSTIKPITELIGSIDVTFQLVQRHDYFHSQFQPLAQHTLESSHNIDILKRAVRKMRFYLHPDRLPKDMDPQQSLLCKVLWDVMMEAWDAHTMTHG